MDSPASDPVLIEKKEASLHIVLNRPEAINSLTLEMVRLVAGALEDARTDDSIRLVVFRGTGGRGFCAGGDIKLLAGSVSHRDIEPAMQFLKEENDLDLSIYGYPKPLVVLAHGITMGGGLGLSAGTDITVATETTRMAMPETRIGFFPDVGATGWLFRKCRKKGYPEFLGLTGYNMSGVECVRIGIADCLIPMSMLDAAREALDREAPALPAGREAAARRLWKVIDPFLCRDIPEDPEMDRWTEDYFAGRTSVKEILDELSVCSIGSDLCRGVFERLSERSPSAVVATLKRLRRDEGRDMAEVFAADLEVARYLMQQHDFREGVRARLIDRDDRPAWNPATFDQASGDEQLMTIDRF